MWADEGEDVLSPVPERLASTVHSTSQEPFPTAVSPLQTQSRPYSASNEIRWEVAISFLLPIPVGILKNDALYQVNNFFQERSFGMLIAFVPMIYHLYESFDPQVLNVPQMAGENSLPPVGFQTTPAAQVLRSPGYDQSPDDDGKGLESINAGANVMPVCISDAHQIHIAQIVRCTSIINACDSLA